MREDEEREGEEEEEEGGEEGEEREWGGLSMWGWDGEVGIAEMCSPLES